MDAFRDLWTTVKSGRPWEGVVKNRAKNGAHANVTPVVEGGELDGFISNQAEAVSCPIVSARPGRL
jgi:aerotaxis receptor